MSKRSILFADNVAEFLNTRREFLEKHGFEMRAAPGVAEAKAMLVPNALNLTVLNLRLVNDEDSKGFSGLELAKPVTPTLPKIVVTKYLSIKVARNSIPAGGKVAGATAPVPKAARRRPRALRGRRAACLRY
ncbi:MAG: hypothetical protein M5U01_35430 [Ardenticatenaceae bacterium]|nr:hypothetical protein [Ardenticatenaceae bacterium]HBY93818.1 hypothetical protein [Chloroflexota bacterium]